MNLIIRESKFQSFKGRKEPNQNQIVKVYKNLHNGLWSIKDAKSGLVLGYASEITLHNCSFEVSEKGRQRVLRDKRKNVHAYAVGAYQGAVAVENSGEIVTYNPYKDSHFTTHISNRKEVVSGAEQVVMIAETSKLIAKNIK